MVDRDSRSSRRRDDEDDGYRDRRSARDRDDDRGRGRDDDDRDRGRGRGRDDDDRDRDRREDRGASRERGERDRFLIKLENVRLSYPSLWQAKGFQGGRGGRGGRGGDDDSGQKSFQATFLIPKDTDKGKDLYDRIRDVIDEAMKEKWGKDIPRLKDDKFPLHDGDDKEQPTDGYDGHWYLSARSQMRPKVMDNDGKTPLAESDGKIFAGDFVHGWVRIWVMDNNYGRRVCASLEAVQFIRQGERFGAAPISDDEFQDERSEEERRGSRGRRGRDDDDRGSRRRRDDDGDDRGRAERGRGRDDDDRGSRRGRDDDDERAERRRRRRDDDDDRD
jgi:hypothetical protein